MKAKIVIAVLFLLELPICLFAQKTTILTIDGVKYAAISSQGMPKGYEVRNLTIGDSNSFYYQTPLYTYSEKGEAPPVGAIYPDPAYSWPVYVNGNSGEIVQVKKIVRHSDQYDSGSYSFPDDSGMGVRSQYNPNTYISKLFAVAPTDIYDDGATTQGNGNSNTMNWSAAAGFLITIHNNHLNIRSSATEKGCYMYQGKNGTDPKGTWRLPVQRELILMCILKEPLAKTSKETDFVSFYPEQYWSAAEYTSSRRSACTVDFSNKVITNSLDMARKIRVRCVKEILLPEESKK